MSKDAQRRNEEITADSVYLADLKEEVSLSKALDHAKSLGGDLVEVNANKTPPICKVIVSKEKKIPKQELTLEKAPLPLALILTAFENESQPFRKVHRLIDAIEVLIKIHTVAVVSDYFNKENISDEIKGLLGAGLKTPSLGVWWQFARDICKAHEKEFGNFYVEGIDRYVLGKQGPLFKAIESKDSLISLRNSYAHGATPPDEQCQSDVDQYGEVLRGLVKKAGHFSQVSLITVTRSGEALLASGTDLQPMDRPDGCEPGKCYLIRERQQPLSLHPLIVHREDSGRFFFYNDMRAKDACILNYETCLHIRDNVIRENLLETYPIHEWAKRAPQDFLDRIEDLTQSFKGRREDLNNIIEFVEKRDRGFLMVWGGPGIGKSALLARSIQTLQSSPQDREADGLEPAAGLGNVTVVEYFIRRSSKTDNINNLLDNLSVRIEQKFKAGIPAGNSTADKFNGLMERLKVAGEQMGENDRLILFIDGLDEGETQPGLLENLPTEAPKGVIIIYASRQNPRVTDVVYNRLDREAHDETSLDGLKTGDIRALLYEYVNKYDLQSGYVEAIANRSEGNPLYLKLLCQGLERNDYTLNDSSGLPLELSELYKGLFEKFNRESGACDFIRLLSVARDYLPCSVAADMLGVTVDDMEHRILRVTLECLFENPLTENVEDYQLFHESLRQYTQSKYVNECLEWEQKLAKWCAGWPGLAGNSKEYAVLWLIPHTVKKREILLNSGKTEDAAALVNFMADTLDDPLFRESVFNASGNASALQRDFRIVQRLLAEEDKGGSNLSRIIRYAKMYHDEATSLYQKQLVKLGDCGRRGDLSPVAGIARMGQTPRDKTLLVIRGLWENPTRGSSIPLELKNETDKWLNQANNPDLNSLIDFSIKSP